MRQTFFYFVRVNGVLVGTYICRQVAFNHASDLHYEEGFDEESIIINGKSFKDYIQ